MVLTVCICTYNRADDLKETLKSIKGVAKKDEIELLIIDNNSNDGTDDICNSFASDFTFFRYCKELKQGLSHARNRGLNEASGDWILYLDDDIQVEANTIAECLDTIKNSRYEVFGGKDNPWFKYPRPEWFLESWIKNSLSYDKDTVLGKNEHLIGCVFCIKKSVCQELGGFNTSLGMIEKKIGYGEETDIQNRAKALGVDCVYTPSIVVKHLVPEYKFKIKWLLESGFVLGRDIVKTKKINNETLSVLKYATIASVQLLVHIISFTPMILIQQMHYKTWFVKVFRKPIKWFSMSYSIVTK